MEFVKFKLSAKKDKEKEQTEKDSDKLNKGDKRTIKTKAGTVTIGTTQNGETIVNRDFGSDSSRNKPTIEIQGDKNVYIKIRYNG